MKRACRIFSQFNGHIFVQTVMWRKVCINISKETLGNYSRCVASFSFLFPLGQQREDKTFFAIIDMLVRKKIYQFTLSTIRL